MIIKNKILFIIGLILILSSIGLFTYNQLRTPDYLSYTEEDFKDSKVESKKEEKKNTPPVIETKAEPIKEILPKPESKITEEVIEEEVVEPIVEETKTSESIIAVEKTKHYYIISGVYSVESNAEIHVDNLKKEGYKNALVIGKVNNLFNVSFGTYSSQNEAETNLNEIKEKFQSSAWILYI